MQIIISDLTLLHPDRKGNIKSKLNKFVRDIKEKLEKAQSAEDVLNIIKAEAAEKEFSLEDAKAIFEKLKLSKGKGLDGKELGEDELENVAGSLGYWYDDIVCFFSGHKPGPWATHKRKDGYNVGRCQCLNCGKMVWLRVYDNGLVTNATESEFYEGD